MKDSLKGQVETIVFQSTDTGFTVARVKQENSPIKTILGTMPSLSAGECGLFQGNWQTHPQHGKQFFVDSYEIIKPSDVTGIQKYLESGLIQGIGPVYAKKIVSLFGENTLDIIENMPQRLKEVPGLGQKRIDQIIRSWKEQSSIREVMIFLQGQNISPAYAQKIYRVYKERSIEKVKSHPYDLAKEVFGIGFKMADAIAMNVGFTKESKERLIAGIAHTLWEMSTKGHTCVLLSRLISEAKNRLDVEEEPIQEALQLASEKGHVIVQSVDCFDEPLVWIKSLHQAEKEIASELKRLLETPIKLREVDVPKAIEWVQKELSIQLAEEQKTAIESCLEKNVHIVTGGPGTGKSTITNAIITILAKITDKIALAAPTGRAAKRLTQITRKKAFTIHSLLEIDFTTGGFKRGKRNPLNADVLIIDEASMIDTFLMQSLLYAVADYTRVLFIGDVDQLPSVGPGSILQDMISSNVLTTTKLEKIFRQAAGSKIIVNAHKINRGDFPDLGQMGWSDFHFHAINSQEQILEKIVSLVTKDIPEKKSFHPIWDIQVLSPMKKGILGTEGLNKKLQSILNPSKQPFQRGEKTFHLGDKVMQIRNNYQKKVYNGELGELVDINLSEKNLSVAFDQGKIVEYEFNELDEITLAYAVSIHKSQGSEFPCIIVPIHSCHYALLCRNLLYTAVTRGKKFVVLVGTKKAVGIAIRNDQVLKRTTGLKIALHEAISSEEPKLPLEFSTN